MSRQITGSKAAQKVLTDREREKEEQAVRDLGHVLSTAAGRRFVFRLIDKDCGVFGLSYTGNSETFLREGMRKVGIKKMLEVQTHFKDRYVEMLSEAFQLKKRDDLIEELAKVEASREGDQ